MTLYSPVFMIAFLPLSAALYRIARGRFRKVVLCVLNIAFYAFASGKDMFVLPVMAVAAYGLSFIGRKGFYICIAMLIPMRLLGITTIGVSFFILRAASYIQYEIREKNIFKVFAFLMFFPCVHAGPLVRYKDFDCSFERGTDYTHMSRGILLMLYGAFKKLFFADALYEAFSEFFGCTTSLSALLALFAYALYIYFDFSGCSDMAIGVSAILGFDIPKNFDFPYMSRSVGEFFRRWHISLGRWLYDYVYLPLGGSKNGKICTAVSLFAVWLVSALWHGLSWSYLLWGLYFFIISAIEKIVLPKNFKIGRYCTLFLVLIGWVIFFSDTPSNAVAFLKRLFSIGNTLLYSRADIYNTLRYMPFMLLAAFFATPLPRRVLCALYHRARPLLYIASPILFLLIISCLLTASHIPFLYASF